MKPDFNSLFNFVPQPLMVVDNQSKYVCWANASFYKLIKESEAQFLKKPIEEFLDTKSAVHIMAAANRSEPPSIHPVSMQLIPTDGEALTLPYALSSTEIFGKSYVLVWLYPGLLHPVSLEEKDQRQELIHLTRLADMGRLSAGIAHELNNPLMIIQGYAENMNSMLESDKPDTEEFMMSLMHILKSVHRMTKIISGIKRFVRNDDFNMVRVDLSEIVPEAVNLLKPRLDALEIDVQIDLSLPRLVKCDPTQIEQIVVNILNNAIHALGKIDSERRIIIRFTEIGEVLSLEIWNNGPEVPVGIREKILSPFFTTKEIGEGTGLGLSVSYGIMRAHNGNLRFESQKSGTGFFLEFPKIEKLIDDQKGKGKVLVVDDEMSFTWIFANKLRLFGFEPLVAQTATEALKIVENETDLLGIFLDLRMPDTDGLCLTRQLRQRYGDQHQIFLVTGYPLSFNEELKMKRAGIDDLLPKPVSVDKLAQIVEVLVGHAESPRFQRKLVS